jgi:hypothetical protein
VAHHGRFRPHKFFRSKLLKLTSRDEIEEFLRSLEEEQERLIEHVLEIAWLSRGGTPYDQVWHMSHKERQIAMKQGEQRMKVVKETKLPLM